MYGVDNILVYMLIILPSETNNKEYPRTIQVQFIVNELLYTRQYYAHKIAYLDLYLLHREYKPDMINKTTIPSHK